MTENSVHNGKLNLVVGIATAGRREVLSAMFGVLSRQTRLPDRVVVCPALDTDIDPGALRYFPAVTQVISGPPGLCSQRNAILAKTADADVIVFFDDDFLPHPTFLAETERLFVKQPDVVAATGKVLADGITGPGISFERGQSILAPVVPSFQDNNLTDIHNAYGCNMAFRLAPIRQHRLSFDEALPLYAWLEDVDFCRAIAPYGRIVQSPRLLGVHLGTKGGRTSGVRFGYSQIANPIYMARKGTLAWNRALQQMGRNIAANIARVWRPESWIDRRGRVKGNYLAFRDLMARRLAPQRILELT
jgi:GT2 family glycosyltransferase